jgi:hypothetical protein
MITNNSLLAIMAFICLAALAIDNSIFMCFALPVVLLLAIVYSVRVLTAYKIGELK